MKKHQLNLYFAETFCLLPRTCCKSWYSFESWIKVKLSLEGSTLNKKLSIFCVAFKKYFCANADSLILYCVFCWHEWDWLVSFQMSHRHIYLNYLFLRIELYFQCASDSKQTWRKLKSQDPRSQKYLQVRQKISSILEVWVIQK